MSVVLATLLGLAGMLTGIGTPEAGTGWWHPEPGLTWQWQLADSDIEAVLDVDIYDLDGVETSPETIRQLKDRGIRTICYLNVGAWEEWRPDAEAFPESIIGASYPGWEGERFLDIRQLNVLAPIMEARLDTCAKAGFDAVEPDNMDSWDADTGFPLTREDALAYSRWLADAAHARGLAIGQKNAPELTSDLVAIYDFAITEDCAAGGWCDEMGAYKDAGKAVLATEYTDQTDIDGFRGYCMDPALKGLSLILKHRDLDAWRMSCDEVSHG